MVVIPSCSVSFFGTIVFKVVFFFQQLDNLITVITPDQVIPCMNPPNRHRKFDLLYEGRCYQHTRFCVVQLHELYHLLEFPAMFTVSTKGNLASSEEAFILAMVKLATGKSNVELADLFGFCGDAMVSLIYCCTIGVLDNKATGI
jgi:hypothetical protein